MTGTGRADAAPQVSPGYPRAGGDVKSQSACEPSDVRRHGDTLERTAAGTYWLSNLREGLRRCHSSPDFYHAREPFTKSIAGSRTPPLQPGGSIAEGGTPVCQPRGGALDDLLRVRGSVRQRMRSQTGCL